MHEPSTLLDLTLAHIQNWDLAETERFARELETRLPKDIHERYKQADYQPFWKILSKQIFPGHTRPESFDANNRFLTQWVFEKQAVIGEYRTWDMQKGTLLPINRLQELWSALGHLINGTQLGVEYDPILSIMENLHDNTFVTGSADGVVHIRESETGKVLHSLRRNQNHVRTLRITSDNKFIFTGCAGGILCKWDAQTYNLLSSRPNAIRGNAIALSLDNELVVIGNQSQPQNLNTGNFKIEIRDVQTDELLQTLQCGNDPIGVVAISKDKSLIATGCSVNMENSLGVQLWDRETGEVVQNFNELPDFHDQLYNKFFYVHSLAISADNSLIVAGFAKGIACIWNIKTGELLTTLRGNKSEIQSIIISPDNSSIVTCSFDGALIHSLEYLNKLSLDQLQLIRAMYNQALKNKNNQLVLSAQQTTIFNKLPDIVKNNLLQRYDIRLTQGSLSLFARIYWTLANSAHFVEI